MKVYVVYDSLYEEVVKVFKSENEADEYSRSRHLEVEEFELQ